MKFKNWIYEIFPNLNYVECENRNNIMYFCCVRNGLILWTTLQIYTNLTCVDNGENRIGDPRRWPAIKHYPIIQADLSHKPERSTWKIIRQIKVNPFMLLNPDRPIQDATDLMIPEKYCNKGSKFVNTEIKHFNNFRAK
jgi:hypothetical protein